MDISTWDASEYLDTVDDVATYLNTALEDENPAILQAGSKGCSKSPGNERYRPASRWRYDWLP